MSRKEKIVYIDGGLASQMSGYSFYHYLKLLGFESQIDLWWFKGRKKGNYKLKKVFGIEIEKYNIIKAFLIRVARRFDILGGGRVILHFLPRTMFYTQKPTGSGEVFNLQKVNYEFLENEGKAYFWGYWWFWTPYIEENITSIREEFTFPVFDEKNNIEISEKMHMENSVCIHIRRGDFLDFDDTFVHLTNDYYKKAIEYIGSYVENPYYFIFSNDAKWCRDNLEALGLNKVKCIIIDWNSSFNDYRDMQLMIECKHFIVANSGFSSWAAVLNDNPNKIVVAPNKYLTDNFVRLRQFPKPVFPKDWVIIDI